MPKLYFNGIVNFMTSFQAALIAHGRHATVFDAGSGTDRIAIPRHSAHLRLRLNLLDGGSARDLSALERQAILLSTGRRIADGGTCPQDHRFGFTYYKPRAMRSQCLLRRIPFILELCEPSSH